MAGSKGAEVGPVSKTSSSELETKGKPVGMPCGRLVIRKGPVLSTVEVTLAHATNGMQNTNATTDRNFFILRNV